MYGTNFVVVLVGSGGSEGDIRKWLLLQNIKQQRIEEERPGIEE